ncbi:MAG: response regulator [Deltaproteobacteria bacterium]|nr:response regulator [Deltaproteobacteria bacterium]
MPQLSGVDVCRELSKRESIRFVYTVIITAKSEKEDIVSALDNGAHDFLSKPYDKNALKSRINVAIRLIYENLVIDEVNMPIKEYAT